MLGHAAGFPSSPLASKRLRTREQQTDAFFEHKKYPGAASGFANPRCGILTWSFQFIHLDESLLRRAVEGGRIIPDPETICLLIVEDHAVVAEALVDVLGRVADIEVVGNAASIAGLFDVLDRAACPDVVLLDMWLADGDGVQATPRVRAVCPGAAVLILTASDHIDVLAGAVRAGASGLLTKDEPLGAVLSAIREVHAGRVLFDPATLSRVADHLSGSEATTENLTRREREVLELLAQGASTATIAQRLVISPHTVRSHVRSLLTKLGANSKLEGLAIAVRRGLVEIDPEE